MFHINILQINMQNQRGHIRSPRGRFWSRVKLRRKEKLLILFLFINKNYLRIKWKVKRNKETDENLNRKTKWRVWRGTRGAWIFVKWSINKLQLTRKTLLADGIGRRLRIIRRSCDDKIWMPEINFQKFKISRNLLESPIESLQVQEKSYFNFC